MRRDESGRIVLECVADCETTLEIVTNYFVPSETGTPTDLNVMLFVRGLPEALREANRRLSESPEQHIEGITLSHQGSLAVIAAFAAERNRSGDDSQAGQLLHMFDQRPK